MNLLMWIFEVQFRILPNLVTYFYLVSLLFVFRNLTLYVLDVKYQCSQIIVALFLLLFCFLSSSIDYGGSYDTVSRLSITVNSCGMNLYLLDSVLQSLGWTVSYLVGYIRSSVILLDLFERLENILFKRELTVSRSETMSISSFVISIIDFENNQITNNFKCFVIYC